MGSSGTNNNPISRQLPASSLQRVMKGGIRVIDSGHKVLSSKVDPNTGHTVTRTQEYVLVLNRRNNYSIRERIVSSNSHNSEFKVSQTFKDNSQAAITEWRKQKKEFDL